MSYDPINKKIEPCFALVDCNNFYASCERLFNPKLIEKPVIVLSNNDGCVIARSNEAKMIGIKMGEPFFKIKQLCKQYDVAVYSSNFALYGDISHRVMQTLSRISPDFEIYSIDEAFLRIENIAADPLQTAINARKMIAQNIGIPVSVGIANTKTLSKVANFIAKKEMKSTGVFDIRDKDIRDEILRNFPVEDLWGVGRRWADQLHSFHIYTAKKMTEKPDSFYKKNFNITLVRLVNELRGIHCLDLEALKLKKNIVCSRSFGENITDFSDLSEAVSTFTARACQKLRSQHSKAMHVGVFIRTSPFDQKNQYFQAYDACTFLHPTSDTTMVLDSTNKLLKKIYKKGVMYKKAGVVLLNIIPDSVDQPDLFLTNDQQDNKKIMDVMDNVNKKYGQQSLFVACQGVKKKWLMRQECKSNRFTTCIKELAIAFAR